MLALVVATGPLPTALAAPSAHTDSPVSQPATGPVPAAVASSTSGGADETYSSSRVPSVIGELPPVALRTGAALLTAPSGVDAAAVKSLHREVFGFFHPADMRHMLTRADFSVLSTIAFFGIAASSSGRLKTTTPGGATDSRWAAWKSPAMTKIIAKAHAAGTRVVLTVARFGWSPKTHATTEKLLANSVARQRLARQIAAEVVARGVDGATLDFEPIPRTVKHQFVTFVHEVRSALDAAKPGLQLTVEATGFISNYLAGPIVSAGGADAIYIMAYPYHGSWSTATGNISPLTRKGYDLHDTIATFEAAGAPASKLILGLPFYGYEWSTVSGAYNAPAHPAGATFGFPFSVLYRTVRTIVAKHPPIWNAAEQAPYARWKTRACSACPQTWRELYFDNVRSYGLKFDLVNTANLRGVGIWALGYEGDHTELNALLRRKFGTP